MIKNLKKIIAPFLSYSIFLRGLFFMPHPVVLFIVYLNTVLITVCKYMRVSYANKPLNYLKVKVKVKAVYSS